LVHANTRSKGAARLHRVTLQQHQQRAIISARNEGQDDKVEIYNRADLWDFIIPPRCHLALQGIK